MLELRELLHQLSHCYAALLAEPSELAVGQLQMGQKPPVLQRLRHLPPDIAAGKPQLTQIQAPQAGHMVQSHTNVLCRLELGIVGQIQLLELTAGSLVGADGGGEHVTQGAAVEVVARGIEPNDLPLTESLSQRPCHRLQITVHKPLRQLNYLGPVALLALLHQKLRELGKDSRFLTLSQVQVLWPLGARRHAGRPVPPGKSANLGHARVRSGVGGGARTRATGSGELGDRGVAGTIAVDWGKGDGLLRRPWVLWGYVDLLFIALRVGHGQRIRGRRRRLPLFLLLLLLTGILLIRPRLVKLSPRLLVHSPLLLLVLFPPTQRHVAWTFSRSLNLLQLGGLGKQPVPPLHPLPGPLVHVQPPTGYHRVLHQLLHHVRLGRGHALYLRQRGQGAIRSDAGGPLVFRGRGLRITLGRGLRSSPHMQSCAFIQLQTRHVAKKLGSLSFTLIHQII
mmetsp:Transcript_39944/g.89655  ORF Transcript_39944/g.89655 Transcript_39944/m.89655 type:complete len:452 (-) Transcript_39944:339-1694(-)